MYPSRKLFVLPAVFSLKPLGRARTVHVCGNCAAPRRFPLPRLTYRTDENGDSCSSHAMFPKKEGQKKKKDICFCSFLQVSTQGGWKRERAGNVHAGQPQRAQLACFKLRPDRSVHGDVSHSLIGIWSDMEGGVWGGQAPKL